MTSHRNKPAMSALMRDRSSEFLCAVCHRAVCYNPLHVNYHNEDGDDWIDNMSHDQICGFEPGDQ